MEEEDFNSSGTSRKGEPNTFDQFHCSIVELGPDDWKVLRDLKLESLKQEPIALEDVQEGREKYTQRTEEEWRDILSGKMSGGRRGETLTVFARDDIHQGYVGMVSSIIPEGARVATIQHMYVDSAYRGRGIGKKLLRSVIERIKKHGTVDTIELQVVVEQEAAIGLYKSLGFVEVGRIKNAAKRGDTHYDEYEMRLSIQ